MAVPEYRIVTKIDPAPAVAGAQKVKQELQGLDAAQSKTETGSKALASRQTELMRSMTGSAGAVDKATKAHENNGRAAAGMASALDRVLKATDAEAASTNKMNKLLADANRLYAAGAINAGQLAKVNQMVAQGSGRVVQSLGQQRAGYTQLGFQIQDITQTLALGINPMTVLAQQGGQTASALSLALGPAGTAGKVATFMAGPFGSIILAAGVVLGGFAIKALMANDALDEAVEKLKKDAEETEIARQAKERFTHSEEGLTAAIRDRIDATKEAAKSERSQAERDNIMARQQLELQVSIRKTTEALLEQAIARNEIQKQRSQAPGERGDAAAIGLLTTQPIVDALQAKLNESRQKSAEATALLSSSRIGLAAEAAERAVDPVKRINYQYDEMRRIAKAAAGAITGLTMAQAKALEVELRGIEARRKAALDANSASKRHTSDGVSRFASREQAIGQAIREIRGVSSLRASENNQAGGVRGNHPGMGNAAHGRFAVDINDIQGGSSEQHPDIKARFDAMARLYQKRGYRVLWNKQVYEANGNGPSRPIPSGQNQHTDHMHLEAPATIVGKPSNDNGETSAFNRDANAAATTAEQKRDFIDQIVSGAAGRGLPNDAATKTASSIDKAVADYTRRFNEAPSPDEVKKITGALTSAEARETAQHFTDAYITPLEDLQLSLEHVGIARKIFDAQQAEAALQGRALTDVEKANIANSITMTDVYGRMGQVLADINSPVEDYKLQLMALNKLLQEGTISQAQFNGRVADLQAPARALITDDLPGQDPNSGLSYGDLGATLDENARYAAQLQAFETYRQQLLDIGVNYDALTEAAKQSHEDKIEAIENARRSMQMMAASNLFGSLAEITAAGLGKQSAIYKAMFIASKAFAIADSIIKIQQAIASATMSLPFPANLPAIAQVAALGASIISTITSTALNLADGGMVRGPGGPRDDKVPVNASNGEFMVNAAAVARPGNRAMLETINNGGTVRDQRRYSNDNSSRSTQTGGGNMTLQFGDVVVHAGSATGNDAEQIGRETKAALIGIVRQEIEVAQRPGGRLTRTRASGMTG